MTLEDFGQTMREARFSAGLTQSQIAAATGVSRATINYIENGKQDVSFATIMGICEVLGLDMKATPRPNMANHNALKWVVSSANTSYRNEFTVSHLVDALTTGTLEEEFYPQLTFIINEVSQSRQIQMIKEIAATRQLNTKQVLKHFKQFAEKLGYPSSRWLHA
jgi:transcriptional regulator with XRE-family HTH domain